MIQVRSIAVSFPFRRRTVLGASGWGFSLSWVRPRLVTFGDLLDKNNAVWVVLWVLCVCFLDFLACFGGVRLFGSLGGPRVGSQASVGAILTPKVRTVQLSRSQRLFGLRSPNFGSVLFMP